MKKMAAVCILFRIFEGNMIEHIEDNKAQSASLT